MYKSYRSWSGLSPTTTVFLLKAGANPNIVFEDNTGVFVTPLLQTLTGTMGIYHGQVSRHTTNHCPTSVTNKDTTNNTYCCHLEQRWSNQSVYIRPRLYRYLCVTSRTLPNSNFVTVLCFHHLHQKRASIDRPNIEFFVHCVCVLDAKHCSYSRSSQFTSIMSNGKTKETTVISSYVCSNEANVCVVETPRRH